MFSIVFILLGWVMQTYVSEMKPIRAPLSISCRHLSVTDGFKEEKLTPITQGEGVLTTRFVLLFGIKACITYRYYWDD